MLTMNFDKLMRLLQDGDEMDRMEVKSTENRKSVLETVCAYSNEPSLEGGYILLGLKKMRKIRISNTLS